MTDNTEYTLPSYPAREDVWDILARQTRPVVVYGMGNGADKLASRLSAYGVEAADYYASDGFVRGQNFRGKKVLTFAEIKEKYDDFVILLAFGTSRPEMMSALAEIDREYDMYVPDMPAFGDTYFDKAFYNANYDNIKRIYDALSDDLSRKLYAGIIRYKLTGKYSYLVSAVSSREDRLALLHSFPVRRAVDGGAYNGDTLRGMIALFPELESVCAVEPDARSFKKLSAYAETLAHPKVKLIHAALWSSGGTAAFHTSGNRNSSLSTASFEHQTADTPLVCVDETVAGADYIKYDVEGAEEHALMGSQNTIQSCRPILSVSAYHRGEDLVCLGEWILDNCPGYDLYLRREACIPAWELDFIAIPRKM